jgi:hypothetical protein
MSGLGAGHVRTDFLEFDFSRIFGFWIDFDDLHFTDSPNAAPLIVWNY